MKPRYLVRPIPIYRIVGPTPGPAGLRHHLQRTRGYMSAKVRRVPLGVQREIWRRDAWAAFAVRRPRVSRMDEVAGAHRKMVGDLLIRGCDP